jgi:hypothetical protein
MKPPETYKKTVAEPDAFLVPIPAYESSVAPVARTAPGGEDSLFARSLSYGDKDAENQASSELKHDYVKVRLPAVHRFLRISSAVGC